MFGLRSLGWVCLRVFRDIDGLKVCSEGLSFFGDRKEK